MRLLYLGAIKLALCALSLRAEAAELVMVNQPACLYCAAFEREVAPTYSATELGRLAPLRRVSALKRWPADLKRVPKAFGTPVFILVDHGRELGRFSGYSSSAQFWVHLRSLVGHLRS